MKSLNFDDKVYFNQPIFESQRQFWKEKSTLFKVHPFSNGQTKPFISETIQLSQHDLLLLTKNRKEATWLIIGTVLRLILPYFVRTNRFNLSVFPAEPDTRNDFLPLDWESDEHISFREILNRNKKKWSEVLQNRHFPIRVIHPNLQWSELALMLITFDSLHAFSEESAKDFPIHLHIQTTTGGFLCHFRLLSTLLEESIFASFLEKFEKSVAILCQNPDAIISDIFLHQSIFSAEDFEQKRFWQNTDSIPSNNEVLLQTIWQEVLGISEIGVEDNFFFVGGDSIKAIQILIRLQQKGFRLELKDIFEQPTIRNQAFLLKSVSPQIPNVQVTNAYLPRARALSQTKKIPDTPLKVYPLSSTQAGIFFRASLLPESQAYYEQISYRIKGIFEVQKWKKSYEMLIQRHDILRTSFWEDVAEIPLQIVWEKGMVDFTFEDISQIPESEQNSYIQAIKQQHLHKKYAFEYGTLMRLHILQLNAEEWEMIWSHHHILMDGWCLSVLMEEFWLLYLELQETLSPVVPYQNYIDWVSQQDSSPSLAYWKTYLEDYSETVGLPYHNVSNQYQHRSATFSFSRAETKVMQDLCNHWQTTLSTFWQVLWGILLHRYNVTEDAVFGKIVSGRPSHLEGIERMVGVFIQVVPCRIRTQVGQTVEQMVKQHQSAVIQQEDYQYVGLSEIQKVSPLREKLFNHLWVFENYPIDTLFFKNQAIEIVRWDNYEQTEYDFNLLFFLKEEALHIQFLYNGSLYSDKWVKQTFQHLQTLATQIIHSPTIEIQNLSLCTPKTRLDLVQTQLKRFKKWHYKTIIPLFQHQQSNADSLLFSTTTSQSISFQEVYQKALQVSFYLVEILKTPQNARIGVRMERSEYLLSVILGILQAGFVYVPIDPSYPEARQQQILEDAQCACLIEKMPEMTETISQNLELPELSPHQIAYLIYTSGSTGTPKGVCITHQNLANFIQWALEEWKEDDFEEILAGTSIGFDLSIFELIYGFCAGKNICLLASNHEITQYLNRPKILLNTVPSVLKYLADNSLDLQHIAAINTAGEPFSLYLAHHFQQFPQIRLRNLYAPSETTTYSTCYLFPKNAQEISVGVPISNTLVLIADRNGNPQPENIIGEIWIGGDGVAQGYWQQTEMTQQKFISLKIPNRKKPIPFYKTGDIGRWSSEKGLIYLNRADEQVKINGFRIELGEIEHQLKKIMGSANCAVLAITSENNTQLVAFVEANEVDSTAIQTHLAEVLPSFMLPQSILPIDSIPLTSNGKIDKKALTQIFRSSATALSFQPAQNPTERLLVEIWQKLLNYQERISINANFFQLGGDSIKAMQFIGILRQQGYSLNLQALYLHPTIEALQHHLKVLIPEKKERKTTTVSDFIPLSPIQKWFFENFKTAQADSFAHYHHFNQSLWLKTAFPIHLSAFEKTLQHLVEFHRVFQSSFYQNAQNEIVATYLDKPNSENWQIRYHSLPSLDLATVQQVAQQSQRSLHITTGKWIQVTILETSEAYYCLFVIHHLVIDGVSWRIFLEDFWQIYQAILHSLPLPTLYQSDSYALWSDSLPQFFETEQAHFSLNEWKNTLQLANQNTLKFPETPCLYRHSQMITTKLDKETTQALLKEIHSFFQTEINDLLLTALLRAYQNYQQAQFFTLWLEGHGREPLVEQVEIIRTIGWFTSLFPVCVEVIENDIARQIRTVKETLRRIPHKGASYGVWKYLSMPNVLPDFPPPQIVLNYLGELDNVAYSGISIADLPSGDAVFSDAYRMTGMEWNLFVQKNELIVQLTYSAHSLEEGKMNRLLNDFVEEIKHLIQFCQNQTTPIYSPSDFGNHTLSLDDFDQIQKLIEGIE